MINNFDRNYKFANSCTIFWKEKKMVPKWIHELILLNFQCYIPEYKELKDPNSFENIWIPLTLKPDKILAKEIQKYIKRLVY